jgi:hypothetical protein
VELATTPFHTFYGKQESGYLSMAIHESEAEKQRLGSARDFAPDYAST